MISADNAEVSGYTASFLDVPDRNILRSRHTRYLKKNNKTLNP